MEKIKLLQLLQLLQNLIMIKSVSGQETALSEFILNYCHTHAISTNLQNGNAVIHIKGNNHRKALIFNAHLDTVDAGNINLWQYPPYGKNAGKHINNKIYGLGASDDKAAIAVILTIARSIINPPCDLWFTFVCCEETDGSGTKNFLKWFKKSGNLNKYNKIAAIICEPTNLNSIEIGNRGNVFIQLETTGISGHGALNYNNNELAVEKMLTAIMILKKVFKSWKKKYHHKILGGPNLNITNISSSIGSVNKIPYKCSISLDVRTTPDFHDKLILLLKNLLKNIADITKISGTSSPQIVSSKSNILKIIKKILPKVKTSITLGSSDLSIFLENGIDSVVFGPGNKETIHKENEYAVISSVEKSIEIYTRIISAYGK